MATKPKTVAGLDRRKVVAALLEDRGNALVVTGLGSPTYDTFAAGDHDLNFYLWGGMGGAAMVGLGLALAQPKRRVLVITGDGEMLMGLGSLATIAVDAPKNLAIAVIDNGHYGETGMQPSHTNAGGVDLVAVARGCGFAATMDVRDEAGLATLVGRVKSLRGEGPLFARLAISAAEAPRVLPERDGVVLKNRFRAAIGLKA